MCLLHLHVRIQLFLLFLVLTFNLFNSFTEGTDPRVRWFIFWKTIIFQGSRGRPTFYGVGEGSNFFPGWGGGGGGRRPNANFCRNLSKLWFSPDPLSPLCIRACSAFTCSSDPVTDLHLLVVCKLGETGWSFLLYIQEGSGSVVECLTRDREAAGSSLTGFTVMCPWARHIDASLVLVQPRKTCPYITEKLLMGRKESNPT